MPPARSTSSASIRGSRGFRARLATFIHARPQSAMQPQHKCRIRASSAQVLPRAARQHALSTSPVPNRSLSWIAALPERRVHRRLFVLDLRCNCQIVRRGLGEPTTSDRLFESCFKAFADDHTRMATTNKMNLCNAQRYSIHSVRFVTNL